MADYNANIKVNADTRQAESQLKKLQTSLDKLSDISTKVNLQSAQQQFNKLGTALKGIGERGALGAITLGAGKATVAIGGLGAKMGMVGAAAASMGAAVNGALGGVPGVVTDILAQVGNIPNAFGLAAVAAMAFAPQVLKASSATVGLGAAIDKAVGAQTTQKIADVVNSVGRLNTELEATKTTFADLIEGNTLNQLNSQLKDAAYQSGEFHSSTEEAVTAAQQLVAVQKEQRREQKAITDLIRQAQGLQPQDVRDTEVARRVALLKSREIQQKKDLQLQNQINAELAEYERLAAQVANQTKQWANNLDRIARSSKAGVLGSQSQIQARLQEFRENRRSAEIARQRSAELVARERQLAGGQYSLAQVPTRGELFPGGRTQTAMEQYRSMLNEQARIQQAAASALQRSERTLIGLQAQTLRTEQDITAAKRQQQTIDERSIQVIREQNKLLMEQYRAEQRVASGTLDPASLRADRLRRVEQGRARQRRRREMTENVIIGGAFPMLFGGGPGAVLGGAAGGFIPGNPMLSVATSALGAVIDEFAASAASLGAALNPATADLDALTQALGLTGTATAEYINKLQTLERQDEALAVATEEMARLVGYKGVQALKEFGDASTDLSNEWSKAMTQMQAALAELLAGPVRAFANELESANLYRQAERSSDPAMQALIRERNRPGSNLQTLTAEIVEKQRQANAEAQKRAKIETETAGTLDQQRRVLEAQLDLAYTDGDLTKDKVYQLQQVIINKEFEVKLQQAINDGTSSELIQLERKVKLQQLAVQREQALQAAAEKAANELERQRKEMERMAKLRREQLSEAQRGFVLAELDVGVTAAGDDKARAQAEFDRRRAERMYEYTDLLQNALSEEERIALVATQELKILEDNLLLNKELYDIDLQRSKLLNEQGPAAAIQEEINLLAAKIQGKQEEYELTKLIRDLEAGGAEPAVASGLAMTLTDLNAQNEAIEAQKQLWADIYTTVAGQLQNAITGLIDGTTEWGDLLSNILGSLGGLFLNAAFSGLGSALKLPGFADGGFVTRPTAAVVGEGAEPEYIIPASKMRTAMARYAGGARGDSVVSGDGIQATTAGGGTATMEPIDVRYSVERINNVDYVTADQFQRGMAQAAQQGAIQGERRAMRSLKNSSATRRSIGV